eukprot:TRINITY_DN13299_c0_g1_i1.p1 TRINITY_DN13299_c0_g1~~TRINITY_DN13299_c0_g1_i1.p1  ORF type:complete len:316 (+),score=75.39 TRINITY_DN13299_c0_g1_i1:74-1021(+)
MRRALRSLLCSGAAPCPGARAWPRFAAMSSDGAAAPGGGVRSTGASAAALAGSTDFFGHEGQAEHYASARPTYPEAAVAAALRGLSPEHFAGVAVDIGCGSGQLTAVLAPHFRTVEAFDRSEAQLAQAPALSNVRYRAAEATALPLPDGEAALITVAQALHWFDAPAFFAEARRVLRPGGRLCVMGYGVASLELPEAEAAFKRFYYDTIGSGKAPGEAGCYWDVDRRLLDSGFAGFDFSPFVEVNREWVRDRRQMSVAQFVDYISSMSAYQTYRQREPIDPLPGLAAELGKAAEQGGGELVVSYPFFVIGLTLEG